MLGFEIDDLRVLWVEQFIYSNEESEKYMKLIISPELDKNFVGIVDEKYTYLLDQLNIFLDKHCGDAVEKYIYLEDIN